MSSWRQLRAIVLLPGMATLAVPALILWRSRDVNVGWGIGGALGALPTAVGAVLIGAGLALWAWTVLLFATFGKGTLAPWDPPSKLVVAGPYELVRNPMITGVFSILLGEAALLGSLPLLEWFAGFFAVNAVYIPLVEERALGERFGADYEAYRRRVPRWLPRGPRRRR